MPDYKKGRIYKIVCNETNEVYYGSTCNLLCYRKSHHKNATKQRCVSKSIIERGNWDMVLVEYFPCNTKEELLMRERFYIDNNECINKQRPIISKEEHKELANKSYMKRRETALEKQKEKRLQRTPEEKEKDKEYFHSRYELNKEKLLAQCKARREGPKREEILAKKRESSKEYREANRERLNEKVTCECGCNVTKNHLNRHMQTKKHIELLAKMNNSN